ncbi:MAG: hypothetical protein GTN62_03580 [Gemmatimonadales bacterium]|nr:hypothetical protein [Gemmatimonadales bacterium]NIN10388.1 hypothetical protein [Gemmatimonadales bacterium]NIN49180.1 hypothetical protein [Gemmatimonadales bacterium]NIP06644.1 hypothetical protein [Gemmatimonadales bacterium]NIQ99974.1 hypothetical protein [Gemmatimonadales bacterium]
MTEPTEARILYDREALYVGVWLFDSDPAGIIPGESRRDLSLDDCDAFLIVLDTYRDGQNAFVFGTTPAGIEYDGQVTNEGEGSGQRRLRQQTGSGGGFNINWDGTWDVATSTDQRGWYAEFRIPFSTLRYRGAGPQVWGLNLARHIRRRNEQSYWSPVPRQHSLYRLSQAGTLAQVEAPGRQSIIVTPYVLASAHRDYTAAPGVDYTGDLGGDAKLGILPSLTLDLTYNTDFAQVEVDEQQVNLTRFNLFFPEKRPFFLENAGLFAVGTPQAAELFFSRRIGIDTTGVPVPILAGGRLTGKPGGINLGLLDIQTERVEGVVEPNNYAVARVSAELPSRSRLGGIFINRVTTSNTADYNRTYAVDGRLGIGQAITFDGYAALTETPALSGREHAYSLASRLATRNWQASATYTEVGEDFNPEAGFLERSGYRFVQASVLRHLRTPGVPWLREFRPHVSYRGYFDFDGFNETGNIHIDTHVEFANGAFFSPAFNFTREGLRGPFEIAPGVVVPPGTYDNFEAAWRFNSNESASLSVNGGLDIGGFLTGTRKGFYGTMTARYQATIAASLRVSYNNVDLVEGSFETTLVGMRFAYSFSPRVYLQSLIQYNSQAGIWSGNVRFGWLSTAGTGLFIVYNEQRQTGTNAGPLDRALIAKFSRQFSLIN